MKNLLNMKIKAFYRYIKIIKRATEHVLEIIGIKEEDTYMIKLAISEAATNIIEHSYHGEKNEDIYLKIDINGSELIFTLEDYGNQKDVSKIKSRSLDDYQEGGLGVHIIKSVMDTVVYQHINKGTRLIMTKKTEVPENAI